MKPSPSITRRLLACLAVLALCTAGFGVASGAAAADDGSIDDRSDRVTGSLGDFATLEESLENATDADSGTSVVVSTSTSVSSSTSTSIESTTDGTSSVSTTTSSSTSISTSTSTSTTSSTDGDSEGDDSSPSTTVDVTAEQEQSVDASVSSDDEDASASIETETESSTETSTTIESSDGDSTTVEASLASSTSTDATLEGSGSIETNVTSASRLDVTAETDGTETNVTTSVAHADAAAVETFGSGNARVAVDSAVSIDVTERATDAHPPGSDDDETPADEPEPLTASPPPESTGDESAERSEHGGDDDAGDEPTGGSADAVLVGAVGAIAASGAAAASAGGNAGAAGASAGAGAGATGAGLLGTVASLLARLGLLAPIRLLSQWLVHLPAHLPWELATALKYSRYDDSDPLENDRRRTVFETIEHDPGCYLSAVSEESGVPVSTVRHHVRVLEEEGLLTSVKVHGKRRYFPAGEDDVELYAALAEPAKREVLEALAEAGRANNGALAEALERDPSTVSHHLSGLEDAGLVVREREGRSMVNELAPAVEAALLADGERDDERESSRAAGPLPADD